MSRLTFADFPLGEWVEHDTARCPDCGAPVELTRELRAKPVGTFSLAGNAVKFAAGEVWRFRCTSCPLTGPAALK